MKRKILFALSMLFIFTSPVYATPVNHRSPDGLIANQDSPSKERDSELRTQNNGVTTLPPYGLPDAPLYGAIAAFVIGLILIANQNRFRKKK